MRRYRLKIEQRQTHFIEVAATCESDAREHLAIDGEFETESLPPEFSVIDAEYLGDE